MTTGTLLPSSGTALAAHSPSWRARRRPWGDRPREPGLAALALGMLALVSSVHPIWAVPAV
ncbi:hypothetical protein, partial [Rathayibacter tanaceti]